MTPTSTTMPSSLSSSSSLTAWLQRCIDLVSRRDLHIILLPGGEKHGRRGRVHKFCKGQMGWRWGLGHLVLEGSLVGLDSSNRCTCTRRPPCSWNRLPTSPASCQPATLAPPASSAGSSAGCSASACSRPPYSHRASRRSPSLNTLK